MPLDLVPAPAAPRPVLLRDVPGADRVLTDDALALAAELQTRFNPKMQALSVARDRRQERADEGRLPDYLEETTGIRKGIWSCAAAPESLRDRRLCLAAAAEAGALAQARAAGASALLVDLDEATAPGFANLVAGIAALAEAPDDHTPMLIRTRPLERDEPALLIGGHPVSAGLFDLALIMAHLATPLAARDMGPNLQLGGIDGHREARLWSEILALAEERDGLAPNTIRVEVSLETVTAGFEMDEILWELRDRAIGLTMRRAPLTASYLRLMRSHPDAVLPALLDPEAAFLGTCAARMVKVAHRRGTHAIAEAPEGSDPATLRRPLDEGCDGLRIDGPDRIAAAREAIARALPGAHQIGRPRQYFRISPEMLLKPHAGPVTEQGLRATVHVAIAALAAWIAGRGPVRIGDSLHGLASADLARARLGQWLAHGAMVEMEGGDSRRMTADWLAALIHEEIVSLVEWLGPHSFHRGRYASAARIVQESACASPQPDHVARLAAPLLDTLD
ncbi:malate synthase [Limimaricola variabilis]|uniref:malate synthase n=1 Tax=Limimaricola variabilis TaxID=1492771 RepID=A0ABR6HN79_9RHOB|nr:malate synthase A [Limimaricola variabilis]MBB3711908.1 malate synthase [Limimaricola variabilis]